MFRFTIRDVLWLTVVVALCVAWWADRERLTVPFAEYRRLKTNEEREAVFQRRIDEYNRIKVRDEELANTPRTKAKSTELRPVPGDNDYQFPITYPLHYGPLPSDDQSPKP